MGADIIWPLDHWLSPRLGGFTRGDSMHRFIGEAPMYATGQRRLAANGYLQPAPHNMSLRRIRLRVNNSTTA